MNLDQAKQRLHLRELMIRAGIPRESIPNKDGQSVKCPWWPNHNHNDCKPSFNTYARGSRAHCFACGFNLDGPAFLEKWTGQSRSDACREFIRMACDSRLVPLERAPVQHSLRVMTTGPQTEMPELRTLTTEQINQIATVRRIDPLAVRWACDLCVLYFAYVCGHRCWILLDDSKYIAEARRIDGHEFPAVGGLSARKAHTIKGSNKSWPVGVEVLRNFPQLKVMMVEGGPDYLAALHFIIQQGKQNIAPVAMLGTGAGRIQINFEAMRLLAGRRIRIYPHNDANGDGERSARKWAAQLAEIGCHTDTCTFEGLLSTSGKPIKDLNDLTSLSPVHASNLQNLIP